VAKYLKIIKSRKMRRMVQVARRRDNTCLTLADNIEGMNFEQTEIDLVGTILRIAGGGVFHSRCYSVIIVYSFGQTTMLRKTDLMLS